MPAGASAHRSQDGANRAATTIDVGPIPNRLVIRVVVNAASERACGADREDEADHAGGEPELANGEHEGDRERDASEEVGGRRAPRLGAQVRVAEDEAEAFLELVPHARLAPVDGRDLRPRLRLADPEQEEAGRDEAECIDEDGVRRGQDLDEDAAEARGRRSGPPTG